MVVRVVTLWHSLAALYQESSDPQVTGWFTYWKPHRPFAMDMAGFAVNLRLILQHPNAQFTNAVQRGYQESTLLTGLGVMLADLEPKANGCTRVCAMLFSYFDYFRDRFD